MAVSSVGRGEKRWCEVPGYHSMDDGFTKVRALVCKGSESGPTIYVGAGTHGNELQGVEVCRRLAEEISPAELRGAAIIVPILSPGAYRNRTRTNPEDNKDPSQLYPGDERGTVTEQLVHNVYTHLASEADCVIDLHSGGIGSKNTPHVYVPPTNPKRCSFSSIELASTFGSEVLIDTKPGIDYHFRFDRTLASYSNANGAAALAPELGEGGVVDKFHVEYGLRGVRNVMVKLGMLDGEIHPQGRRRVVTRTAVVRAGISGILWRAYDVGQDTKKGGALGEIDGVYGGKESVSAPVEGTILWTTTFGNVPAGGEICWIAHD